MAKVFVLQHQYEDEGRDETKLIGVYSSRGVAEAAVARLVVQPGFSQYPEGFSIDEYPLDRDHWSEGFSTLVPTPGDQQAKGGAAQPSVDAGPLSDEPSSPQSKSHAVSMVGLTEFGIQSLDLVGLEERIFRATLSLKGPALRSLIPYPPKKRLEMRARHLQRTAVSLRKRCRFIDFVLRNEENPREYDVVCRGSELARLLSARSLDWIQVRDIEGLERVAEEDAGPALFAVRGSVAIQVEGQTRGLQKVEDRIVVVEADSVDDALRRLKAEWRQYAEPYLNGDGELVRWQLEEVSDVYSLFENELDPSGTEVWSSFRMRRMKKEYEWHPRETPSID